MKFATALILSAASFAADAVPLYPTDTSVAVLCSNATFDPAGATSLSPADAAACTALCQSDALNDNSKLDETGHVPELTSNKYAGCTYPAIYTVGELASVPCNFTSTKLGKDGFFTYLNASAIVTKESIASAIFYLTVLTADQTNNVWELYRASSASESCVDGTVGDDAWIVGTAIDAPASGDVKAYKVNVTEYYKANDADSGKMYIFAVPGGSTKAVKLSGSVYTVGDGPMQFGVSESCGAKKDCDKCMDHCYWCQLTVGGNVTNGLCGVTEGQCYGQESPFGSVGLFMDQCSTPYTPTSSTTAGTTNTVPTTIAGASSVMMLPFAGAILLGAVLTL